MATDLKAPVVVAVSPTASKATASKFGPGKCPICGKSVIKPKDGGVGSTCYEHMGKIRATADTVAAQPEGWLRMSKVCRKLEEAGITTSAIVRACGGDACTGPLLDPVFRVKYVGRAKYLHPDVLTTGLKLLKAGKAEPVVKPAAPTQVKQVAGAIAQAAQNKKA